MIVEGKPSVDSQDLECYKYWFGKQCKFAAHICFAILLNTQKNVVLQASIRAIRTYYPHNLFHCNFPKWDECMCLFCFADALTPPINYYRAAFEYSDIELKRHDENVPFLFALGSNEIFLSKKIMETMNKLYKTIETTNVQDSGHFMQQEDPEKVNRLIRTFLQKQNL